MQNPNRKKHYLAAICAITIIGLLLRLEFLPVMGSYWFDEMASITIARLDFPKILEYLAIENNPPLSFIYLHFWIKLFGEGENIARMSSLIPSAAAIPLTYLIGKKIFSDKAGIIAAFFMSLSFFQIYYSAEARMYPLFQFLALCSIYFFQKALAEGRKKNWIIYAFSSLLLVYTHIFAWAVIAFQNIFLFIYRKEYTKIKNKIFAMNFLFLLFFLTWFIPKMQTIGSSNLFSGWYFKPNSDILSTIAKIFKDIIYVETPGKIVEFFFVMLILALGASIFLIRIKTGKSLFLPSLSKSPIFTALWIITPIIMFSLFFPSGNAKYVIFIGPALYLLIAQGIISLRLNSKILIPVIAFISLIIFFSTFSGINADSKIFIWNNVASYIAQEEKPGDKILIHKFVSILEFDQYYRGKTPYEGFYLFEDNEDLKKIIIKHNWNAVLLEKDYPAIDKKMKTSTEGYKRIFLVESNRYPIDPYGLVSRWFSENNWRLVKAEKFEIKDPIINMRPSIWLWEKIK